MVRETERVGWENDGAAGSPTGASASARSQRLPDLLHGPFVPYLGALTGIVCMTLGAVLSFDSFSYALVFPAAYLILAILEGNFITPWVMGRSLTLNPVLVLLSLTFWGWMWGIAGVILAVPILAAFKIFCTYLEPLEPVAEFLS